MRPIFIVIVAALAITAVAQYSAKVMTAEAPQSRQTGAVPIVIDIMQMMRQARDLPVQQFDAI
jgi:hypothetical protein